ncbi:MAG: DUF882 domain-containing protein [Piscinibacter sp.]|jgi:uncharacterized protein YcbK (DUF882 family)|nr:DUF882 domain-containing protein [Piscinibacter sp.]
MRTFMSTLPRRRFIAALAALPLAARARSNEPRVLAFNHLHTGERLELEYFSAGAYVPDALGAVNHLLRDFRTGDVGTIDPALLDLLHALRERTGTHRPFQIISGYRSPATNQMLHDRSRGVATKSLHMSGQAIDIRLADVPLVRLRDTALSLRVGGVGFYPGSDFVHVDTGRGRAW